MRYLEKKAREVLSVVGVDPDASPSKVKFVKDVLRSILEDAAKDTACLACAARIRRLADREVPETGSGS